MKSLLFIPFSLVMVLGFAFSNFVEAAEGPWTNYTQEAFDKAQKDGKLVAVKFHASWCGSCKAQEAALKTLVNENDKVAQTVIFHADFDNTKDLQKKMDVKKRTQILLFKHGKEVARITTRDKDKIRDIIIAEVPNS